MIDRILLCSIIPANQKRYFETGTPVYDMVQAVQQPR